MEQIKDEKKQTKKGPPVWEIAVHLAVAGDVFNGVFVCCPFFHKMSWMKFGTLLGSSLERSVIDYWRVKPVFLGKNLGQKPRHVRPLWLKTFGLLET